MKANPNSASPPVPAPPRPFAVIDMGASSIRLRVAELHPDGRVRTLESLQHAVHLGKDTFTTGHIQPATIDECLEVLRDFRRIMTEYGIAHEDQMRAVATSAIREAENRDAVLGLTDGAEIGRAHV